MTAHKTCLEIVHSTLKRLVPTTMIIPRKDKLKKSPLISQGSAMLKWTLPKRHQRALNPSSHLLYQILARKGQHMTKPQHLKYVK